MNRKLLLILIIFLAMLLPACAPQTISKKAAFPNMYSEAPLSILVLPPINETTAADAKEYYITTVAQPLSLEGYYVYPIEVTTDILKLEGLNDTETMLNMPPQKFKEYFGADAIMYIKLLKWDTAYYVVGGHVSVGIDAWLVSTKTSQKLWAYNGTLTIDTTGDSGGAGGLGGLLVKIVATAIKTATADYVPVARQVNAITMVTMPFGKYHLLHQKDIDHQIFVNDAIKENSSIK